MKLRSLPCFLLLFLVLPLAGEEDAEPEPYPSVDPTPAEEVTGRMELLHGFSMELIASEPLVTDPVDICYDARGRAYVAEMNDYPYTNKEEHKPRQVNPTDRPIGKIRLLVDEDGDGVFDRSTVFADGLSWPTGVVCWKGGIYVIATPDLWYFKDHDGDGVADERRKVYTGFRKYNVQAVMNNPIWGLDNYIYIAGSTNGGTITKVGDPDFKPLKASRHDFRFDPRTETLELESGYGRFGNTFDDWGNRFVCNIRDPALHVVMPKRFLDNNPHLPPIDPRQDICNFGEFIPVHRIAPLEAWRVERAKRWAAEEPDQHPDTELVGGGAVTSSAGITVYRGDAYPEKFRGNVFVSEASSALFYRLTLEPDGVSFQAGRPDQEADFCASRDVWTRFVNFENSPDGCLTVLDMYREAVEHPWSIPDDIHARIDLESGRDKGRIFRLVPPGEWKRRETPRLGELETKELIPYLAHPNGWHRETAQRLIVERGAGERDIARIRQLAEDSENALGTIHALWTLEGLAGGSSLEFEDFLHHPSAAVRTQALRIAANDSLEENGLSGAVGRKILTGTVGETARERFWTLLALGGRVDSPEVFDRVEQLVAALDPGDRWLRNAVLIGLQEDVLRLLLGKKAESFSRNLLHELGRMAGAKEEVEDLRELLAGTIDSGFPSANELALAAGLAEGLRRQRLSLFRVAREEAGLPEFEGAILAGAKRTARDHAAPLALRRQALDLFRYAGIEKALPMFESLLEPGTPLELQNVIVTSLGAYDVPEVSSLLIERWPALTPALKQQALEILLTRPRFLPVLLDALEKGIISPHLVSAARRDFLTGHGDPGIASRAEEVFASGEDRRAVVDRYREAIAGLEGDPEKGRVVYQQFCRACHRAGEEGEAEVGPNLSTVQGWDRDQLITNILDPNREVSPDFIEYLVEKNDGTVVGGAILNETDAAVLLRRPDGSREAVYRRDISEIRNSGLSLMPEGLEVVISPQQMADLLAFMKKTP